MIVGVDSGYCDTVIDSLRVCARILLSVIIQSCVSQSASSLADPEGLANSSLIRNPSVPQNDFTVPLTLIWKHSSEENTVVSVSV